MKLRSLLSGAALLTAIFAAACTPPSASYDYHAKEHYEDSSYVIGTGDILRLTVYQHDDLSTQATVRPDGQLALPLIGDVPAAGYSAHELAEEVAKRYTSYLDAPRITINMVERHSYKVYVFGEVGKPGMIASSDPVNVVQALSLAGGFSRFADRKSIVIVRRDGEGEVRIPFDYSKVSKGKAPEQNFLLRSGDTIIVP